MRKGLLTWNYSFYIYIFRLWKTTIFFVFSGFHSVQTLAGISLNSLKRPSGLAGGYAGYAFSPLGLSTRKGAPHLVTTTTRPPVFATSTQPDTSVGTTEIVAEAETEIPSNAESVLFDPEEWINQFDHKQTHVKIAFGNNSIELLWQNELVNFIS